MANELETQLGQNFSQGATTSMDAMFWILVIVMPLMIIFGIIIFIRYYKSFDRIVDIKEMTDKVHRTLRMKARLYKNKNGVEFWQLWGVKDKIRKNLQVPPAEAISLTKKGYMQASGYRMPSGDFIWLKGGYTLDELRDMPIMKAFEPVSTSDRQVFYGQLKLAWEEEQKTGWAMLEKSIPIIALVIILLIVLFGWETFTKPMLDAQDKFIVMQENDKLILADLKELNANIQTLKSANAGATNGQPPQ